MKRKAILKDTALVDFYGVVTAGALLLVGVVAAVGFFFDGDGFEVDELDR